MNFKTLAFIIRRLILSKRNKGIVHIISLISLAGVAVGSFALVVVLSVFNGFTDVAKTMLEETCPPLLVESVKGKIIDINSIKTKIKASSDYDIVPIVKATSMVSVVDTRSIVTLMGIDSSYFKYNALDKYFVNGKSIFNVKDSLFCFMGINQAMTLGLNKGAEKMNIPIKLTVPATNSEEAMVVEDKLSTISVYYQASYQTHSDLDETVVFISIDKARQLLDMKSYQCNSLYVLPKNLNNLQNIKTDLKKQLGDTYSVKTILEQEPVYFRIVKSEKLAVYIILSFIIFIATINIVSAVIILHIQKEKMNKIFRTMGMRQKDIKKIYFSYGFTINIVGCLLGILLGLCLCLLQQYFGLIKLAKDAFVVDAFPVKIFFTDMVIVFVLVLLIGSLSINAITSRIKEKI